MQKALVLLVRVFLSALRVCFFTRRQKEMRSYQPIYSFVAFNGAQEQKAVQASCLGLMC